MSPSTVRFGIAGIRARTGITRGSLFFSPYAYLMDSLDLAGALDAGISSQSMSARFFHLLSILPHLFSQHGSGP